jgi:hypothetical protein
MAGCSCMTAADGSHLGSQVGYLDPPREPPGMNPPGAGPAPLWEVQVRNRAEVAVAIRRTAFLLPSPAPGAGRSPNSAGRDPVCRPQPGRATSAEPGAVRAYQVTGVTFAGWPGLSSRAARLLPACSG